MEWFNSKFFAEVSGPLTAERYKQYMPSDFGGGSPDYQVIRGARENVPDHLAYIASLLRKQDWLAGSGLTYADLAAAAHLSVVNNLDDLTWNEAEAAMAWFARVRSRPSFHSMLTEGWTGFVRN
jgi:glutathione S-transferase